MMEQPESLLALAAPPPQFSVGEVARLVRDRYELEGEFTALVSERDQNLRLSSEDGRRFVVKIANSVEPEKITDFQIQALLHIENCGCSVAVPRIIRTTDGAVATTLLADDVTHVVRLVSFLPGRPLNIDDIRLKDS